MTENTKENILKEYVYIETNDYIIKGYISGAIGTKNNRILSNVLNSNRDFVAIENCILQPRKFAMQKELEKVEFIEINKSSILIMKPIKE